MKPYPSIPRATGQSFHEIPNAYIFDKLDGRNIRVEWSRKNGWGKWGTRHRLFDASDAEFAPAIPLFEQVYAESLTKIARDNRWESVTAFLELWQPNSLGGVWVPGETYSLTLFDVAPYKECQMGPKEFMKTFKDVPTAAFLGQVNWTRGYVEQVRSGQIEGVTFEGVVAKAGEKHKLLLSKAKQQRWVDALMARYGEQEGKKLAES